MKTKNSGMQSLKAILGNFDWDSKKSISREFQDYGYRLAEELEDLRHKSLYMKMAKELPRHILENARSFVLDAKARNKGSLFMWKVEQLKKKDGGPK